MRIGLLGKKIGMTRVYDDKGRATAVTVIEAGGNTRLAVKTTEKDGYSAVQVGFDTQKNHVSTRVNSAISRNTPPNPRKSCANFALRMAPRSATT